MIIQKLKDAFDMKINRIPSCLISNAAPRGQAFNLGIAINAMVMPHMVYDPGLYVPNDSIPPQQGMDEGTKNTSFDHRSAVKEEEVSRTIKLEDLVKLVSHVQPSFKNLDSPEDDPIIVVDDGDEDEEADKYEVHPTTNAETKDASVPKSSSPRTKLKLKWELPAEFLSMPTQVEVIQAKLKTLDALPSLLHKVTNALNQFAQAFASEKTEDDSVPSEAGT
ncbi:hypothetical protein Tco_0874880 [Tanacetum coccineum]|uniref:Uncharacterized protein n=1 Tax=Tanacetum coccineum TaxID=301880 RepID=A0ABQ5BPL3_9ASTR